MDYLKIERSDGAEQFERYLINPLLRHKSLLIPNDLDEGGGFGSSVAYCQFLLTWARLSQNREIRTYLACDDEESHTRFSERVHGLFAAYVTKRFLTPRVGYKRENIRTKVLQSAKDRIEAMSNGNVERTSRGREIEFVFIQGANNEFHGSIYSKAPSQTELMDRQAHGNLIRTPKEISRLLEKCFTILKLDEQTKDDLLKENALGIMVNEVFRNTAEHAYLDIDGKLLRLNMRCLKIGVSSIEREKLASTAFSSPKANEAVQQYFESAAKFKSGLGRKKLGFLEISTFDSGPGLAATITGNKSCKSDQARLAVIRCFKKHESSKPVRSAGMGLHRVLQLSNKLGGFIRMRTSSVEVFYGSKFEPANDIDVSKTVYGGLQPVEGTAITIGIPVFY